MYKTLSILLEFFSLYGIYPGKKKLRTAFLAHPYFPSLLAIRDTIESLEYDCLPVQVPKQSFEELPLPCLAIQRKNGQEFLTILKDVQNGQCRVYDQQDKWHTQSQAAFLEKWTGIALLLDEEKKKESLFTTLVRLKRGIGLVLMGLAIFMLLAFVKNFTFLQGVLFILNLAGLFISGLLTFYHFTNKDELIHSICRGGNGDSGNCTGILNSKSAYIYKTVSWSELGLLYFLNLSLLFLFADSAGALSHLLKIYLVPGVLFSIYSIAFQIVKKQKCNLCLLTVSIIWSQIALLVAFDAVPFFSLKLTVPEVLLILLLSISSLFWFVAVPGIKKWLHLEDRMYNYLRFRLHPEVVAGFLEQQDKAPPMEHLSILETSNEESKHTITIVTNPTCKPCQEAHNMIKKLQAARADIRVRYIFLLKEKIIQTTPEQIKDLIETLIPDLEQCSFTTPDKVTVLEPGAVTNEPVSYHAVVEPQVCEETKIDFQQITRDHRTWCEKYQIDGTPTMFINDRELPLHVSLQDLTYYLKYR
ncbi:MAG: vitamin K epoxide reductase family protein [Saprospiraceae bacterium]|nr:hypothetical protein [Lewinella sp.]